jgi:hypothetical protein
LRNVRRSAARPVMPTPEIASTVVPVE